MPAQPEYDPISRLRERLETLKNGSEHSGAEVLDLFRLVRLVLDHTSSRRTYHLTALFADWLQHTAIDRQPSAWAFAERINYILTDAGLGQDFDNWHKELHKVLGLPTLRTELIALFERHALDTWLFTSLTNWRSVIGVLLHDLCNRPMEFTRSPSSRSAKEALQRMSQRHVDLGWDGRFLIRRFFITLEPDADSTAGQESKFWYNLICKTEPPHVIFRGEYRVAEPAESFANR